MKKMSVKATKTIGGNTYYIRPFGAFKAARISGDISSVILPVIGSFTPLVKALPKGAEDSIMDMDAEVVAPALAQGLSNINGSKVELLLKSLLTDHGNVTVQLEGEKEAQMLTEDLADEVFCGDIQDAFIVAFEVIKVNYGSFFTKLAPQFGNQIKAVMGSETVLTNMAN